MNAKKLLSTLLSAAMAVSMLAGCFGGGGNKNYSDEAADAANAAQSTVVFATDTTLAKSLQDALADGLTQLDEIDDAMEADENLKPLLTSGWDLDIFAAQGEDAEAAAKTIAEQYIVSAVIGKKAEGKIAMVLHDGNGYYYVAVLTYGGGSGSGGGTGGGSGSGDNGNRPGPGDDDDEENGVYDVDAKALDGNGTVKADKATVKAGETVTITVTPKDGYQIDKIVHEGGTFNYVRPESGSPVYTMSNVTGDVKFHVTFFKEAAPDASTVTFTVTGEGTVTNTATNEEIKDGDTLEMVPADKMNFTVTPDDGWKIAEVSGANVTSNGNGSYTLSNVTENTTVTVTFEEIVYKVSPNRILNGRVVVNPSVVYPSRGEDSVTITLHPNDGYELGNIEDIKVSVGTVATTGTDNQYIWSGITEDATVDVEFKKSEYIVNVYGSNWNYGFVTVGGSKITNNSDHPVKSGEDFTFTVKANPTGEVASVKVDSVDVTKQLDADGSYTIKDVTANHTVEVNFAAKTYTVDLTADENGKVFPTDGSTTTTVAHGNDFFFTAEPDPNYEVDSVTVKNSQGNEVAYEDIGSGDYIVRDVKDNLTVTVKFVEKQPVLTGLKVELKNSKAFFVGDTLKRSDLNVYPIYDGVPSETPLNDSDFDISGTTHFTDAKKYTITVNHKGVTGTVDVHVKEVKVIGISLINPDSTITRHARTVLPHDTFFYIWDGNYIGAGLEICDDIKIIRKYNNGESDDSALTPSELEDLIEADVIWSDHDYKFYDYEAMYDYITVTISYQDKDMSKPVTTQINVTVKWNNT